MSELRDIYQKMQAQQRQAAAGTAVISLPDYQPTDRGSKELQDIYGRLYNAKKTDFEKNYAGIQERIIGAVQGASNLYEDDVKAYNARRKQNEKTYVTDAQQWYDSAVQKRAVYDAKSKEALQLIEEYEPFLSAEWVRQAREGLSAMDRGYTAMSDNADMERQYWAQFPTQEEWLRYTDPERAQMLADAKSKWYENWFQKGAMEDGFSWSGLGKTIAGTWGDAAEDVWTGLVGMGEKALDAIMTVLPYMAQGQYYSNGGGYNLQNDAAFRQMNDSAKQLAEDFVKKDLYDEREVAKTFTSKPIEAIAGIDTEQASILGDKTDALAQSYGQLMGQLALTYAGVPWWVTSGATSLGAETENALHQGATMDEAALSGVINAGAEILTEKLFGGSGLGEKGLINLDKLTQGISNKVVKTLLDYGVDLTAEGSEEFLAQVMSNLASKLYKEENLGQLLVSEEALQGYIESFIGGMALSGGMNVGKVADSIATRTDYRTGLTAEQQKVFDKAYSEAYADALTQAQMDGQKLTGTDKRAIYDAVLEGVKNGSINAQTQTETQSPDALNQQSQVQENTQAEPGTLDWVLELAQLGAMSNKQAQQIVDQPDLYQMVLDVAGIESPNTQSGKRNAVKQAVAQIGQQQTTNNNQINIDNANNVAYNNSINGGEQIERTAGIGEDQGRVSGVYGVGGTNDQGRTERSGVLVGSGFVLLSPSSQEVLKSRGVVNLELHDSSMDNAAFSIALNNARNADTAHGWAVTPKTAEELTNNGVRTFMTADGSTGFGITPDGDIVAVFANKKAGAPKGSTKYTIPLAIANGGTKLDCYGDGLVTLYAQYGFVPVARTAFNPEYANPGWTADKGNPDIYFMMHNGDSADTVVQNYGQYHIPTKEELDALPLMEYDDAYAYRDELLAQQKAQQAPQTAQNGQTVQTAANITPATNEEQSLNAAALGGNMQTNVVNPDDSVGAAPAGFDLNSHLQYQYGTMRSGENPVRPDDLPNRDANGNPISLSARTVKGAEVTPDSFEPLLNRQATGGALSYVPITNNATTQKAIDGIMQNGWSETLGAWEADVRNGKASAEMVATGALLLNNAAQAGDKATWLRVLHSYQQLSTTLGQGLQAMRILKTLDPSDKLYMIRRSVQQLAKDAGYDLIIDENLARQYQEAKTDAEADKILDQIAKDVAKQLKTTWGEKWTALRYLNMLGNFRTQIRNLSGNVTMGTLNKVKNAVAVGIETAASKISGGKIAKTKSLTVSKAQYQAAAATYDDVAQIISNGGRYNDANTQQNSFMQKVQDNKTIFKNKLLEGYRKATSWAMEAGDVLFSKPAYARALAGYLKAKGITETDYSKIDSGVLADAMAYAVKEAQETTFLDNNWLSTKLSQIGRDSKNPKLVKAIIDGIIPFRKTPANVLIRAVEYSPLSLATNVAKTGQAALSYTKLAEMDNMVGRWAAKGGEINANTLIDSWAKSLTGSGLFFLGMLLFNNGWLNVGEDDDEQKAEFDRMNGVQPYSLNIGGNTYTIDWASPAAVPLLMGGEFMKAIGEDGFQLEDLTDALASIADPMIEMSMLQGVNDTLENIRYSDQPLAQILINAALSYLTQGITNTALGQIERAFEDSRMTTYVDKDSDIPSWLQQWIGKVSQKIPGWDYQQIPYINAWGEEDKNMNAAVGLAYNMLSPGYGDLKEDTPLTRELYRLDKAQGKNVFPPTMPQDYTVNGEKVNMTADQYVEAAKMRGQTQKQLVQDLIDSDEYSNMTEEEKAAAVLAVYSYAWEYTKSELFGTDTVPKWMAERPEGMTESEAIIRHVTTGTTTKYSTVPVNIADYTVDMLDALQPESGSTVRPIQKLEAVMSDKELADYKEALILEIGDSKLDAKYEEAKKQGYSPEDFVTAYRIYLYEKEEGGKGTKERTIREMQQEFGVSYEVAKRLYEVYG